MKNNSDSAILCLQSVPLGFIVASMNVKQAAALLGKRGGKAKSKRKVAAAKRNGKLGGRPKKSTA